LGLERAGDRIFRTRKDDEERVALRIDLAAVRCREGFAQESVMLEQHRGVRVAQAFQQGRRALDVGEDEGQRSVWELRRHSSRRKVSTARTRR
jgi:hypothetical protein